jgi:hypothetical protein
MTESEQARLSGALEAWVDTQNRRDFSAYSGHYAEEFRGTKRVGERATHFNRARWLLDRQPMFKPGLNVEVRDARFERVEDRFFATFTQDFSTPQFRDTGKKLLVFVKTFGGLQIIREEMLSSEVQGGGGSVPRYPGFFAALPHGVVLRSAIDERWLTPKRRALAEAMRRQAEEAEYFSDLYLEDDFLKLSEVSIPPEVMAMRG